MVVDDSGRYCGHIISRGIGTTRGFVMPAALVSSNIIASLYPTSQVRGDDVASFERESNESPNVGRSSGPTTLHISNCTFACHFPLRIRPRKS